MGGYCDWDFINNARGGAFLLLIICMTPLANSQPVSFGYNFSNSVDVKQLNLEPEGDFSMLSSGIQLTAGPGSVGRVTSSQYVHLWNKTSNELKNFTTQFSFLVTLNQGPRGDGFTFFLANQSLPHLNDMPRVEELKGGGLGIGRVDKNITTLTTEYQFVAVEFDTFSNAWDPRDPHVGVNVDSMQSDIAARWLLGSTEENSSYEYDCSIEYDSGDNFLKVNFTEYAIDQERVTHHFSYHIDLRQYLEEWVIVGISASTGDESEEQHILTSWSFNKSLPSNVNHGNIIKSMDKLLLQGMGIGLGLCGGLSGLGYILSRKSKKRKEEEPVSETNSDLKMDDDFQMGIGPKKVSYEDLVSATNNFEETQKLGQGGFGCVYKGYLKELNSYAAIKRISANSTQGVKEYAAEVIIISQLRHRNLVKLVGWCHKRNDLFLIYEYMPNGSLDLCLFGEENFLSWQVRYNVALGLASALLYLQEEWEKCVLHRDIKSSNIMLDSVFNAKLGDFGLARLVDHEKGSHTTAMSGTMGYLAPEYMSMGKVGKESDIFSFGIVLLEIATGRRAIQIEDKGGQVSLVEWVWKFYTMRNLLVAADPNLCEEFDVHQMECLLVVGLCCAHPECKSRPSIRQVIKVLNFEAPLPILPQQIPRLIHLPETTDELFFTVSSS